MSCFTALAASYTNDADPAMMIPMMTCKHIDTTLSIDCGAVYMATPTCVLSSISHPEKAQRAAKDFHHQDFDE